MLQAFRGALKDSSRCVRHIAARMVARARPAWAAADFGALAKDADAGLRETGLLGLGELEDPATLGVITAALGDRDVRSGPWPPGRWASWNSPRRFPRSAGP